MSSREKALTCLSIDLKIKEPYKNTIELEDNRLNILVQKVSFKSRENLSDINDRQYVGATVLETIYKKDGEIIVFTPEEKEKPFRPKPSLPGE